MTYDQFDPETIEAIEGMALDLMEQMIDDEDVMLAVLIACANSMGSACTTSDSPTEALEDHLTLYGQLVRKTFVKALRNDDDEPFLTTLWPREKAATHGALQ